MKLGFVLFSLLISLNILAQTEEKNKTKIEKVLESAQENWVNGWSGAALEGTLLTEEALAIHRNNKQIYAAWKRVMPDKVQRFEVMEKGVSELSAKDAELNGVYEDLKDSYVKARDGYWYHYTERELDWVTNLQTGKREQAWVDVDKKRWIAPDPEEAAELKPKMEKAHADWAPVAAKLKEAQNAFAVVTKDLKDAQKKFLADDMNRTNPDFGNIKSSKVRIKVGHGLAILSGIDLFRRGLIAILPEYDSDVLKFPEIPKDLSFINEDSRSEEKKTEKVVVPQTKKAKVF